MDAAARALAEPTRREILRLVRDDERTVGDIADNFPVSRPAISQHLRVLEEAELVTVRSEGTRRYYRARPEGLTGLRDWLDGFWALGLDRLRLEVEREQWQQRKERSASRRAHRQEESHE
ncbi:MAG: metalloregulator ArsR/SmtB family transcription factor [Acidimicrobiia bacterium]|nr:metalloregulator ArsR/SmtB family transcription factor [Acidimicrobiia bacterium]